MLDRGAVTIAYLKGFPEIFKSIVSKHGVKTAFWPGAKIKESKSTTGTPLGDKKANTLYQSPCKCKNSV